MTTLTAGLHDRRCPTCGASPGIACHKVSTTDRLPTGSTHLARRPTTPTRHPATPPADTTSTRPEAEP